MVNNDTLDDKILSVDAMFPDLQRLYVNENGNKKLQNGNILKVIDFFKTDTFCFESFFTDGESYLIYDTHQDFKAIYRYDSKIKGLKADKMFL